MTGVFFDRNQQVRRSAVVQEEQALPDAPKRRGQAGGSVAVPPER